MHSHDAEYRESGNGWATKPKPTAPATTDVYRERAHLIAHLAAIYPAVLQHGADPDAPGWPVLYVNLPTGQVSWHISPDDLDLLQHVPAGVATWDGHDTAEKYRRLDQATAILAASHAEDAVDFPPRGGHNALCAHAAGIGPRCTCPSDTPEADRG